MEPCRVQRSEWNPPCFEGQNGTLQEEGQHETLQREGQNETLQSNCVKENQCSGFVLEFIAILTGVYFANFGYS